MGLDLLVAKKLAHRALNQTGQTGMSGLRSVLARMAGQKPRRPKFVRVALLLALSHAKDTSQAFASGVITGSLPGRGRSSSAASKPSL